MFNLFKTALGTNSFLGVDIGTSSIKISEISKEKNQFHLKNYGILESYAGLDRANSVIQTSSLKISTRETCELIKTLVNKADFGTRDCVVSIPPFASFITLIELPQMSDQEILSTMQFQIGQYIPLPLNEVKIEWIKVGEKEDDQGFVKQEMLLISIPNETIELYKRVFECSGLRLKALEIESLSLVRSLALNEPTANMIVDLGAWSTNIVISSKGDFKYNHQTDHAGANLSQAISKGLGVNVKRAEQLKKEKGLLGGAQSEISTLMLPYMDVIINEIKRAKEKYESHFSDKIEKIILTGGGSKLLGIDQYLSSQLGTSVVMGNAFSQTSYDPQLEPILRDIAPGFSVSAGLAMKGFLL